MKKYIVFAQIAICAALFLIPFFWLKQGFVDIGSDGGRLYFFDPLGVYAAIYKNQNFTGMISYAMLPYLLFLYGITYIFSSPTLLIACEHGIQLSIAFWATSSVITTMLRKTKDEEQIGSVAGIVGGIVYIGFITAFGWQSSLLTHNQVFLNPLLFLLLLQYSLTGSFLYGGLILLITVIFSGSFGFAAVPQLFSFFPLVCIFLWCYLFFVLKKPIPWKKYIVLGLGFLGLHAFHLMPLVASFFEKGGVAQELVFTSKAIGNRGVQYFEANHLTLGKLSTELFRPSQWHSQNILIFFIPLIGLLGFFKKPSRLLGLVGIFFAITFFLVSANITNIGVQFYRLLFFIPGFSMFRSFDEKWYFVYAFFYALLFVVSFHTIFTKKNIILSIIVGICVILALGYRITPFVKGRTTSAMQYQSDNVSTVFTLDPDLLDGIKKVKVLPDDGNVWTLPMTFPYFQVAYGKEGGAYVGISMVENLGGKKDFPGFWTFGPHQESLFEILRKKDTHALAQLLSLRNIRYIFQNTDERIMQRFPGYPYVYPGELYYSKDIIPAIMDQSSYGGLLSQLPLSRIFQQGFYIISLFDEAVVRPTVYIPDTLYASQSGALEGASYRSSYGDEKVCRDLAAYGLFCDGVKREVPILSFTKQSKTAYDLTIDIGEQKEPFLVVLSEEYHNSWNLKIAQASKAMTHISINGYANAWIVDPKEVGNGVVHGTITLGFQKYYTYGLVISITTLGILIVGGVYMIIRRKHGKT